MLLPSRAIQAANVLNSPRAVKMGVYAGLINAMRELMRPPEPKKKQPIGFVTDKQNKQRAAAAALLFGSYPRSGYGGGFSVLKIL